MWAFFEQDTCWIKLKGQRNVLQWLIQTSQPWQPSLAGVPGPQWVEASEKILLALEAAAKNHLKEKFISSPLLHIQLVRLPGQVQGEDLGQGIQNVFPLTWIVIVALLTRKMITGEMMRTRTRTATPNPCCSFAEFNSFPTIWLIRPWSEVLFKMLSYQLLSPLDLTERDGDPQCIDRWKGRTGKLPLCRGFESSRFESLILWRFFIKDLNYLLSTALPGPVLRALVLEDLKVLSDVNNKVFWLVQIFRAQGVMLDELDIVVLRDVSLAIVSAKHLVFEWTIHKDTWFHKRLQYQGSL